MLLAPDKSTHTTACALSTQKSWASVTFCMPGKNNSLIANYHRDYYLITLLSPSVICCIELLLLTVVQPNQNIIIFVVCHVIVFMPIQQYWPSSLKDTSFLFFPAAEHRFFLFIL